MSIELTNKMQVSLISAACLLALVIVLKNILLVPVPVLTRDIVLYIMLYSVYGVLCPDKTIENQNKVLAKPLYWNFLIILITLAIIVLYAL